MAAPGACLPGMDVRDQVTELVPHLRRYARALGTNDISSDALVSATLERAQGQLERYSPEVNLRVWLFSLMHDSYIAQLRGAFRPVWRADGSRISYRDGLCVLNSTSATPAPGTHPYAPLFAGKNPTGSCSWATTARNCR